MAEEAQEKKKSEAPSQSPPHSENITPEDLVAFINEKKGEPTCPVCAATDWMFWTAPDGEEEEPGLPLFAAGLVPPAHIPLVVVICRNCGHIRTFARGIIGAWKQGKKS